ncbi:hypothetical protein [Novosphingobium kaempferiae]|uniref:hypothetical protein n=1 Tax=Novosphingobium kaempferiae TaxID=2896849 RepID=UPI001E3C7638|nr:hypothetical protein [Novosphingobium kaempferiae]
MIGQIRDRDDGWQARVRPLLRVIAVLIPAAMLVVLLRRPVWDVDIFWQLKLGEMILDHGGPIPTEPFSAKHLGEPLPAVAWAGQAVMALVRRIGGWELLRVFDAMLWLGGFWAVALACRMRGAATGAVALALGMAFVVTVTTASVRPQSFACLCFGLLLALRRLELKPATAIGLGVLLLLVWQNLHPSVSVGVAAMAFASLPGWVGWLRGRGPVPIVPTALAVIGAGAMFATPDGFSILATSATNAEASMAIGASEWLPLWIPANQPNAVIAAEVVLVTSWLGWRYRRLDAAEVATAAGLLLMTIATYRFMLFWGVAMVPVIARAASAPAAKPTRGEGLAVAGSILLVAIVMPVLAPVRFAPALPLDAVQHLRKYPVHGTIYGDFPFGGVIIDTGYPDWKVAYDGRYYRYSREEWQYNGGIENGIVPLVDVVRKWNPAAFVIDPRHNAPIAQELARSSAWQRIYATGRVVVYVPRIIRRASPGSARR